MPLIFQIFNCKKCEVTLRGCSQLHDIQQYFHDYQHIIYVEFRSPVMIDASIRLHSAFS